RRLANRDAELGGAADELARHARGVRNAVFPAEHGAGDVVHGQPTDESGIDSLHRDAEGVLELPPLLELGKTLLRDRKEEVADLAEERLAELAKECEARSGEADLGLSRKLLANAAHRLAR